MSSKCSDALCAESNSSSASLSSQCARSSPTSRAAMSAAPSQNLKTWALEHISNAFDCTDSNFGVLEMFVDDGRVGVDANVRTLRFAAALSKISDMLEPLSSTDELHTTSLQSQCAVVVEGSTKESCRTADGGGGVADEWEKRGLGVGKAQEDRCAAGKRARCSGCSEMIPGPEGVGCEGGAKGIGSRRRIGSRIKHLLCGMVDIRRRGVGAHGKDGGGECTREKDTSRGGRSRRMRGNGWGKKARKWVLMFVD